MATKSTIYEIRGRGVAELKQLLGKLGDEGKAAFERIIVAAQPVPVRLKAIDTAATEVKSKFQELAGELGPVGKVLGALGPEGLAAGAALGATAIAIRSVTNAAADFQKARSLLAAFTGEGGENLKILTNAALDMGRATTLSATQALEAFRAVGSARPELLGNAAALVEVTKQALILAQASGEDLPTAAKTLTTTLNAMGASSDQAARFVNVLSAGVERGTANLPEFTAALAKSAGAASLAQVPFEQLTATLELLLKFGRGADETGAGFSRVLLKLAQGAADTNPAVVGLTGALDNLQKQVDAGGNVFTEFGNKGALSALQLLSIRKQIGPLATEITATTAATDAAKTSTDNLAGDMAHLSASFETLKTDLGNVTQEPAREFTQFLTDTTNLVDHLIPKLPGLAAGIADVLMAGSGSAAASAAFRAAANAVNPPWQTGGGRLPAGPEAPVQYGPDLPPGTDAAKLVQDRLNALSASHAAIAEITQKAQSALEKLKEVEVQTLKDLDTRVAAGLETEASVAAARLAVVKKYLADRDKLDHEGNAALAQREQILNDIAAAEKKGVVASLDTTKAIEKERDATVLAFEQGVAGRKDSALLVAAFEVQADRQAQDAILADRIKKEQTAVEFDVAAEAKKAEGLTTAASDVADFRVAREKQATAAIAKAREEGDIKVLEDQKRLQGELQRNAQENARILQAPFIHAAEGIQQTLGDALFNALDGGVKNGQSAADAILGIFKHLAAELATLAIGRILIGPALTSLGLGGIAQQAGLVPAGSSGLNLSQSLGGLLGLGGTSSTGTLGALFGLGQTGFSAAQRSQQGGGLGATDILGYLGTVNQAANTAGYGASLSGAQGTGLYFNGQPLYTLGGGFGGGVGAGSAAFVGTGLGPGTTGLTGLFGQAGVFDTAPVGTGSVLADTGSSGVSGAASALGPVLAGAALLYSLYGGAQGIVGSRSNFDKVTHGTAGEQGNALTSIQAGLIAGFTAGGAAAGLGIGVAAAAPTFGISIPVATLIGAGVGASIGSAIASALGAGVAGGTAKGLAGKGVTQAGLDKDVHAGTAGITGILGGLGSAGFSAVLGDSLSDSLITWFTPNIEKILDKILQETVEKSLGHSFNRTLGDYLGEGPLKREGLARFAPGGESRDQTEFFTRLISTFVGAGTDDPKRLERFYNEIVNNLGSSKRDDQAITRDLQEIVRKLVPFAAALRFTNAEFVQPKSTALSGPLADYQARAADIIGAYTRRLPPGVDPKAIADAVIAAQGFLTRPLVQHEAALESRNRAEATGETLLDPNFLDHPAHLRDVTQGEGKKRRARRQGIADARDETIDLLDQLQRKMEELATPASIVTHRFGDIQTALDKINNLNPKQLDQLPQLIKDAAAAIDAWGQSELTLISQTKQAQDAVDQFTLSFGEEIDALTKSTDTHLRYNDVLAQSAKNVDKLAASSASATAQLAAVEKTMALIRAQAQAQITDLQEAAQARQDDITTRLTDIGPTAGLAAGLRDQLAGLTAGSARAPSPFQELERLTGEIRKQRALFTTGKGPEQATAAQQLSTLIGQQLQLAGQTYGVGSASYRSLAAQNAGLLGGVSKVATTYEKEVLALQKEQTKLAKTTADAIVQVQLAEAKQLQIYADKEKPLLVAQAAYFKAQLGASLRAGTDLEAILADPMAAQTLVGNLQLIQLQTLNKSTADLVAIAEGRPPSPVEQTGPPPVPPSALPQAFGGDYLVTHPTLFLAGEAGPERATFTPARHAPATTRSTVVNLTIAPGAVVFHAPPGMTPREAKTLAYTHADALTGRIVETLKQYAAGGVR